MTSARLVVDRMTDEQLRAREVTLLVQLERYGLDALNPSDVRAIARQLLDISREQFVRARQMNLLQ
jgi:hypothetical protein